ncbi:MAG: DoxX family membrane protein, partial [Alicyclobacillus sp.]|nr:DoxX family membrane protein [Alicyclobacillus sp.]
MKRMKVMRGSDLKMGNGGSWQPLGVFALRLVVGLTFILHGWPKLLHSPEMVTFFARVGIPMPSLMVWLVGALEVFGGRGDLALRVWALMILGLVYELQGDVPRAVGCHQQVLGVTEAHG